MLILTRKVNEVLTIGDDVKFTVLGISGNPIKLRISAPAHVNVDREEIFARKKQEIDGTCLVDRVSKNGGEPAIPRR